MDLRRMRMVAMTRYTFAAGGQIISSGRSDLCKRLDQPVKG